MASCLKAEVILSKMKKGLKGNYAELMVRQGQKEGIKLDIRIMLLGDYESRKSTLIGVLTSGCFDNGKGLARMKVLCHKHEVLSGQTSSLSHHVRGGRAIYILYSLYINPHRSPSTHVNPHRSPSTPIDPHHSHLSINTYKLDFRLRQSREYRKSLKSHQFFLGGDR